MKKNTNQGHAPEIYPTPVMTVVEFNAEAGFCFSEAYTDDLLNDDSWNDLLM